MGVVAAVAAVAVAPILPPHDSHLVSLLGDVRDGDDVGEVDPELGEQRRHLAGLLVKLVRAVRQGEHAQLARLELLPVSIF